MTTLSLPSFTATRSVNPSPVASAMRTAVRCLTTAALLLLLSLAPCAGAVAMIVPPGSRSCSVTSTPATGLTPEALLDGANAVMITREDDAIVRVPFADMLDPATGRTRVRRVDIAGRNYATARLLQVHLEPGDLAPGELCERICAAAGRGAAELRRRYFGGS